MSDVTICRTCGLPRFHGPAGYAGPQCLCQWKGATLPQMYDELMAKNAALEAECERLTDELAAERDALAAELSALKAQQAGQELDELRRACAEILGQDPEAWPSHGNAPLAIALALALAVSTAPQPALAQPAVHPDDAAVDRFAEAMKAKLAKSRAKGRGGWEDKAQCSAEDLSELLRGHVDKGDPVDVANFCMMLQQRGEGIYVQP